jgi:hypothetical protein
VPSLGFLTLLAALLVPIHGSAAPITGDPSAGRGAPRVGSTISCGVEPDGTNDLRRIKRSRLGMPRTRSG